MLQKMNHVQYSNGIKVKGVPVLNRAQRHEDVFGESNYSSTHLLILALDGGEWSASRPRRFTPRERASGNHWIGGWVDSRGCLDMVLKRKIHSTRRESSPDHPIIQPVASRYIDWLSRLYGNGINWILNLEKQNKIFKALLSVTSD
jgi:hypothetical protein